MTIKIHTKESMTARQAEIEAEIKRLSECGELTTERLMSLRDEGRELSWLLLTAH